MPKGLFFRAGLYFMAIQIFHIAAFDGLLSYYASFQTLELPLQALIFGLFTGLFFELGRFFVLDKVFTKIRDFNNTAYFAMGWSGVTSFLLGIALLFSSVGLYFIYSSGDPTTLIPDATEEQIVQIEEMRATTNGGITEAWIAAVPAAGRFSVLFVDIALSLMMVIGLNQKRFALVWGAVGIQSAVTGGLYFLAEQTGAFIFIVYLAVGAAALMFIKKAKANLWL